MAGSTPYSSRAGRPLAAAVATRGCSKHTDAAAPHCLTHSNGLPAETAHTTLSQHSQGPRLALQHTRPRRRSHYGRGAGRLLRALLGALRPAQPQRVAPLTYWPLPAMEAGGWYGPCCSILQSKAIHATIDPPTPSWEETCGCGSRPTRIGRKKWEEEGSLVSTDGAIDSRGY